MPAWWDESEPVLVPDSGDLDDVFVRASRKRHAKLNRLAATLTLPVVAAAVTFVIRPAPSHDAAVLATTTESPSPSPISTSASPTASPSPTGTTPGRAPGSASPSASPRPSRTRAPVRIPSRTPSALPSSAPATRPPVVVRPLRVEAESGGFENPNCGDDGPMRAEGSTEASGGYYVFHPGDSCAQTFAGKAGHVVTSIRFSVGGTTGGICGWFEISGGQVGRTETLCWVPLETVSVEVDAEYVSDEEYTIRWKVDPTRNSQYLNANVDFHELSKAPAGS